MTSLVLSPNNTAIQYGENTHKEYGWSHDIQQSIVQLFFQLTRISDPKKHQYIGGKYYELINNVINSKELTKEKRVEYISILYRIMFHTRDIISGKGEYTLFYILLGEWVRFSNLNLYIEEKNKFFITLIEKALITLVKLDNFVHPYGSWKDFKYFLNYLRDNIATPEEKKENIYTEWPVFKFIVKFLTSKLREEIKSFRVDSLNSVSLIAKWIPREKSKKFGWQTRYFAYEYFNEWLLTAHTERTKKAAQRKCLTHYRKILSIFNRIINTIQINECEKNWANIDFNKQATSITIMRQRKAFQYINKGGVLRGNNEDRLICKSNFEKYVKKCKNEDINIKSERIGINELVKSAINSIKNISITLTDIDIINLQWKEQSRKMGVLNNFIAMVDTSSSMECDNGLPLQVAIGLGCRIAEHSKLGKRILTFSSTPSWINLEECDTLTKMVEKILNESNCGLNTNFVSALQLIISACIVNDLSPNEVNDLTLIIFSSMQIDNDDKNSISMYDTIKLLFEEGGMKTSHKQPYKVPHIIFWNLHSTNGFPSLSTTKNVSMLSGFNVKLLDNFCNKGISAFKEYNPWSILTEYLSDKRYEWANKEIINNFI